MNWLSVSSDPTWIPRRARYSPNANSQLNMAEPSPYA